MPSQLTDCDNYVLGRVYDMLPVEDTLNFVLAVPKFARGKVVLPIKRHLRKLDAWADRPSIPARLGDGDALKTIMERTTLHVTDPHDLEWVQEELDTVGDLVAYRHVDLLKWWVNLFPGTPYREGRIESVMSYGHVDDLETLFEIVGDPTSVEHSVMLLLNAPLENIEWTLNRFPMQMDCMHRSWLGEAILSWWDVKKDYIEIQSRLMTAIHAKNYCPGCVFSHHENLHLAAVCSGPALQETFQRHVSTGRGVSKTMRESVRGIVQGIHDIDAAAALNGKCECLERFRQCSHRCHPVELLAFLRWYFQSGLHAMDFEGMYVLNVAANYSSYGPLRDFASRMISLRVRKKRPRVK